MNEPKAVNGAVADVDYDPETKKSTLLITVDPAITGDQDNTINATLVELAGGICLQMDPLGTIDAIEQAGATGEKHPLAKERINVAREIGNDISAGMENSSGGTKGKDWKGHTGTALNQTAPHPSSDQSRTLVDGVDVSDPLG